MHLHSRATVSNLTFLAVMPKREEEVRGEREEGEKAEDWGEREEEGG